MFSPSSGFKVKEVEQAEMGCHKDLGVPQAVLGVDAVPLESDQKGRGTKGEMLQKEEEIQTLLEEKSPERSVAEEERERRVEADSFLTNSMHTEAGEGGT